MRPRLIRALFYLVALYVLRKLVRKAQKKALAGKTVLITGAAGGLGRWIAKKFAARGCKLVLWDIDAEALGKVQVELGGDVRVQTCDLCSRDAIRAAANQALQLGPVDILVNNAGIVTPTTSFLESKDAHNEVIMKVNCMAHFWTVKAFLPAMIERNSGHIVGVSSIASFFTSPGMADYAASKFAARGFMESIHYDLCRARSSVRVSCVCPGHINTELFKGFNLGPTVEPEVVAETLVQAVEYGDQLVVVPHLLRPPLFFKGISDALGCYLPWDRQTPMANVVPAKAEKALAQSAA